MEEREIKLLNMLALCADACNMCSTACLREKDVKMMAECIRIDMDCAQMCTTTAAFIARGSDYAMHLIKECAEICEKCAAECEKHQVDHCRTCAKACRKCIEACQSYK